MVIYLVAGQGYPPPGADISWTSRPMTCVEMSGMLRSFLDAEDDLFLTSHSMKSTTLSWASKAEMPREYRCILGRHSSAVKEADSVYSRDLSFGPVRALERVFVMIREKSFAPDGQRSQFFPMTPQPGAAPAFPPTPVFQAFAPKTPVASFTKASDENLPEAESKNPSLEVKEETSEVDVISGQGVASSINETIEIFPVSQIPHPRPKLNQTCCVLKMKGKVKSHLQRCLVSSECQSLQR